MKKLIIFFIFLSSCYTSSVENSNNEFIFSEIEIIYLEIANANKIFFQSMFNDIKSDYSEYSNNNISKEEFAIKASRYTSKSRIYLDDIISHSSSERFENDLRTSLLIKTHKEIIDTFSKIENEANIKKLNILIGSLDVLIQDYEINLENIINNPDL